MFKFFLIERRASGFRSVVLKKIFWFEPAERQDCIAANLVLQYRLKLLRDIFALPAATSGRA